MIPSKPGRWIDSWVGKSITLILLAVPATRRRTTCGSIDLASNLSAQARIDLALTKESMRLQTSMVSMWQNARLALLLLIPQSIGIASKLDSQEAAFWERLHVLMKAKAMTQTQLGMTQKQLPSVSWGSSRRSVMATMEMPKLFLSRPLASRVGSTQPAISQMLKRKCRPQRSTILALAAALEVDPRELWPELDVTDILDTVAAVQEEQTISAAEADAIRRGLKRPAPAAPAAPLPRRKR